MAKKKTGKSAPRVDPLMAQAQAATDLKYAPEVSALNTLLQAAGKNYASGRAQAESAAASIGAATDQAAPGLADFLRRAGVRQGQTVAQIGPAGMSAALTNEAALAARNSGLDVQSSAARLANEKVRAAQSAAYQAKRLFGEYQDQASQIQSRGADLAKEAGMYASALYTGAKGDAAAARAKAEADARNRLQQRLVAGVDQYGKPIAGSPKDISLKQSQDKIDADAKEAKRKREAAAAKEQKDAKKAATAKAREGRLTPAQNNSYVSSVKAIGNLVYDTVGTIATSDVTYAGQVLVRKGQPWTTTAMRKLLTTKNNPLGRAYTPEQINAGFDYGILGGLSSANVNALHGQGVTIKGNLPTVAGGAKPRPKKKLPSPTVAGAINSLFG